jgi:hypothetical protein
LAATGPRLIGYVVCGDILEDLGVIPDHRYRMTQTDILRGNTDLIDFAIDQLAAKKAHRLDITIESGGQLPRIIVNAGNATRIEAAIDTPTSSGLERRWFASHPADTGDVTLDTADILQAGTTGMVNLEISSYDRHSLVARRTTTLSLD